MTIDNVISSDIVWLKQAIPYTFTPCDLDQDRLSQRKSG